MYLIYFGFLNQLYYRITYLIMEHECIYLSLFGSFIFEVVDEQSTYYKANEGSHCQSNGYCSSFPSTNFKDVQVRGLRFHNADARVEHSFFLYELLNKYFLGVTNSLATSRMMPESIQIEWIRNVNCHHLHKIIEISTRPCSSPTHLPLKQSIDLFYFCMYMQKV